MTCRTRIDMKHIKFTVEHHFQYMTVATKKKFGMAVD